MVRRLDGLYLVAGSETPIESVEAALRGGGRLVQIWSPQRAAHVQSWGQRIRTATQAFDVPLLVNNDLALAQAIGADGLHLDDAHLEPAQIREELGQDAIVGYTCGTDIEKVVWAERMGADYISFCSMFPSQSVSDCPIVPLGMIAEAKRRVHIPVFASGGLTPANSPAVLRAGADGLAIISGIFQADDPEEAARRFAALFEAVQA